MFKGGAAEEDDEEELERVFVRLLSEDQDQADDIFRSNKKVRICKSVGSSSVNPSELRDRLANHIRDYYLTGVQKIIQLQCEALVREYGVSRVVSEIAGSIWYNIVGKTQVFDPHWLQGIILVADADYLERKRLRENNLQASKESNSGKEIDVESVPLTKTMREVSRVCVKSLKKRLPMYSTLSIVFLACHVARQPVLPSDIVEWASNGSLPYLAVFTKIPAKDFRGPKNNVIRIPEIGPRALFRPVCVVNSGVVEVLAGFFGKRLGVELPPVNFLGISTRFLRKIGLETESFIRRLMRLYSWYTPEGLFLSGKAAGSPSRAYVMAMVIVALKLLYTIDGNAESSLYWPELAEFLRPASGSSQRDKFQSVLEGIEKRLLEDAEKDDFDLKKYLKYCQDVVLAGVEVHDDQSARGNDTEASSSHHHPGVEAKSKILKRIDDELSTGNFSLLPGSCIKPPAPTGRFYTIFPKKKHGGQYIDCVSGDYFILLLACSHAARVKCSLLHKCVQEVETDALKVERLWTIYSGSESSNIF